MDGQVNQVLLGLLDLPVSLELLDNRDRMDQQVVQELQEQQVLLAPTVLQEPQVPRETLATLATVERLDQPVGQVRRALLETLVKQEASVSLVHQEPLGQRVRPVFRE